MKLAKIKDGYMFRTDNPNGEHTYALFYDKKSKSYRAVQTTHLYRKDEKNHKKIISGALMKVRFPNCELPSGVQRFYYSKNVNGEKINIKDKSVTFISNRHLPKRISSKIKSFAIDKYETKKR